MLKNILIFVAIIASFFGILLIVKNWDRIMAYFNTPRDGSPCTFASEPAYIEGWIKGGECVPKPVSCQLEFDAAQDAFSKSGKSCIQTAEDVYCPTDPTFVASTNPCVAQILKDKGWTSQPATNSNNSNNPSSVDNLQVSNPAGAFMYYQTLSPASGGMIYGKSNFSLPYGTKLKLVKIWQTNVSTQPFAGYYETNFKKYGANSGFFDTNDFSADPRNILGLGGMA